MSSDSPSAASNLLLPKSERLVGSSNFTRWNSLITSKSLGSGTYTFLKGVEEEPSDPTIEYNKALEDYRKAVDEFATLSATKQRAAGSQPQLEDYDAIQPSEEKMKEYRKEMSKWERRRGTFYQLIFDNLSTDLQITFGGEQYHTNPLSLYNDLKNLYSKCSASDRYYAFKEVLQDRYMEGEDLEHFITARTAKITRFLSILPSSMSTSELMSEIFIYLLISNLPSSFSSFISTLFANDDLESINASRFYQKLIHSERVRQEREILGPTHSTSSGLAANHPHRSRYSPLKFTDPCQRKGCGQTHGTREKFWEAHPKEGEAKTAKEDQGGNLDKDEEEKYLEDTYQPLGPADYSFGGGAFSSATTTNFVDWYIDSGCNSTLTSNSSLIHAKTKVNHPGITIADDKKLHVSAKGTSRIEAIVDGKEAKIDLKNVHIVPEAKCNLLSLFGLVRDGRNVIFDEDGVRIMDTKTGTILATGTQRNGLYILDTKDSSTTSSTSTPLSASAVALGSLSSIVSHLNLPLSKTIPLPDTPSPPNLKPSLHKTTSVSCTPSPPNKSSTLSPSFNSRFNSRKSIHSPPSYSPHHISTTGSTSFTCMRRSKARYKLGSLI